MQPINPYSMDEVTIQSNLDNSLFGLIAKSGPDGAELHGYEITLSGKLVVPELKLPSEEGEPKLVQAILC